MNVEIVFAFMPFASVSRFSAFCFFFLFSLLLLLLFFIYFLDSIVIVSVSVFYSFFFWNRFYVALVMPPPLPLLADISSNSCFSVSSHS